MEVIRSLSENYTGAEIIAAVRNASSAKKSLSAIQGISYRQFDFENPDTHGPAFEGVGLLFLLRPPHLSDIETYFRPLLESARKHGIANVVFLSVQGAEKSTIIPHNKIEQLILEFGFSYVFVRPSYFMQNLTSTLLNELRDQKSVTLPAGKAVFNWIDVKDIGEATTALILDFARYQNQAFVLTGSENKNFQEVCQLISEITGQKITYRSMNPLRFYFAKRTSGMQSGFALVMTLLHFLPRVQDEPDITGTVQQLTGRSPRTLSDFINRELKFLFDA